jgi:hypothetical protein
MFQILNGVYVAGAVACLAQLGVPDLVESGPKSPSELAKKLGVQAGALYRLMRATASVGVLVEGADGRFGETPLSAVLRSNAPNSLRGLAIMAGREWHGRGWSHLSEIVRTGQQELFDGRSIFDFLQENPEEARIFDAAMTALSTMEAPAVVDAYSFEGIGSIVDIAGGVGLLLATVLQRYPQMRGTLYELPRVIERARGGPLKGLLDRCAFASGDMFASVPGHADAYMMKHIIHDWPDDECIKLLKACRKGVTPGGKLIVIDNVIQPGNDFAPGKFLDLQMLIFPGGRERTENEFRELFAAAGWRLTRVVPTVVPESVVEGVPA